MADHFQIIYSTKASLYDRMVTREDYQNHIGAILRQIVPLDDALVVEFGAGTGRLTRLIAPQVERIFAFDFSHHMLETGRPTLPGHNWMLAVGDNSHMPVKSGVATLAIAGWSFGHATGWYQENWQEHIQAAIDEMQRVLKPGGAMVIMETLGTGSESPTPPNTLLAEYYHWMENELGFSHQWIRTDYKFESVAEADELTRFFFGDGLADRIVSEQMTILPECTGVWWKKV